MTELRLLAEQLASQAADHVRNRMGSTMSMETKSSPVDMVTEVDREAEALIVAGIQAARPDDSIVGEEGTGIEGTSGTSWVIDPIDGTTNFVYGFPGFSVSVAVQENGNTIAGAVVDVLSTDLFSAALGRGATLNGQPISCTGAKDLGSALVATGFSFMSERRQRQAEVLVTVLPNIRDIRRQGSAALDLCMVACARVDAYFEIGLNEWDLAAGALIASEAGAIVSVRGEGQERFTVAAAPGIVDSLELLLERSGAATV